MANIEYRALMDRGNTFWPVEGGSIKDCAAASASGKSGCARHGDARVEDPRPARRAYWAGALCAVVMIIAGGSARLDSSPMSFSAGPKVRTTVVAMVDNFTDDHSLNHGLWTVNGPQLQAISGAQQGSSTGGGYILPVTQFAKPDLTFSATNGLEIGGAAKPGQIAGLQSAVPVTAPFSVSTSLMVPSGHDASFLLIVSNIAANQGVVVIGGVNSSSHSSGADYIHQGPKGKQLRQPLFRSLQPNTWYTFSMGVNERGNALLEVRHGSMTVGKVVVQLGKEPLGKAPLWITIGETAAANSTPVYWRSVRIFSGSAAPGIVGTSSTGGETRIVESPYDTKVTAKLEQAARQAPQIEEQQLQESLKKAAASGMSPAELARVQQMEEQIIRQSGQFALQSVPHSFQSSMQLPPGGSVYLYGVVSDGKAAMVDFEAMSPEAWIRGPGSGFASGEMASSTSNDARAILSGLAGGYTIGGVSISGFESWHASYGHPSGPQTNTVTDTFVVSHKSLVVVIGVAAGSQTVNLSGVSGLVLDASLPGMTSAHAYLPPGSYTIIEHSHLLGEELAGATSRAVGVYVFDGAGQ